MKREAKIKMFKDLFAPKSGEKVLFLIDIPHGDILDNDGWRERREMAQEWKKTFDELGVETGFTVDMLEYEATGMHNSPLPKHVVDAATTSHLVIAMTEYSASSSLLPISRAEGTITRCVSMPGAERRMENTAFTADYSDVKTYAVALETMLTKAIGAEILFSTGDRLYIDLRNRTAEADTGECTSPGDCINFPSGEGYIAPYEAVGDEVNKFGYSKTQGVLPVDYNGELVTYVIEQNRIVDIVGAGKKVEEMSTFFSENETRRNIAELGVGCNPEAVITGNILEDEKVGLHIAYGMSTHLNGKVKSDTHLDICYSKGCPVEGTTVTLIDADGSTIELIRDAILRYELLK